jgi:hypothetical protein
VVDLLALPLNPIEFFLEHPGSILELVSVSRVSSMEHGVVSRRGGAIPSLFIRIPRAPTMVLWQNMSFLGCLVSVVRRSCSSGDLCIGCPSDFFYSLLDGGFNPFHHEDLAVSIRIRL